MLFSLLFDSLRWYVYLQFVCYVMFCFDFSYSTNSLSIDRFSITQNINMIYIFTLRYYLRPCGVLNEIYISSRISLPICFYLNCCFCGGWCRHWHWSSWSWYAMALQISREIRVSENAMMFPVFHSSLSMVQISMVCDVICWLNYFSCI